MSKRQRARVKRLSALKFDELDLLIEELSSSDDYFSSNENDIFLDDADALSYHAVVRAGNGKFRARKKRLTLGQAKRLVHNSLERPGGVFVVGREAQAKNLVHKAGLIPTKREKSGGGIYHIHATKNGTRKEGHIWYAKKLPKGDFADLFI
ncbi:MAG: hypothetical protein AAFW84_32195 [Cyanobacteria bacterium J06635_15]